MIEDSTKNLKKVEEIVVVVRSIEHFCHDFQIPLLLTASPPLFAHSTLTHTHQNVNRNWGNQ